MGTSISNYLILKFLFQHKFNFENGNFEYNFEWDMFDKLRHITGQCWELALGTDLDT